MVVLVRTSPRRTLTRWEPFYRPLSLWEDLDRMFERLGAYGWTSREDGGLLPRIDMHEEENELVVKAELPGVSKDDIKISFEDNILTIDAEKKVEEEKEEQGYYMCERYFGRYHRHISLPARVDADKASSTFDAGVLEIRLPKAEEAKPKHIEIKAS